jgi:hypothetical protein
MVMAAIGRLLSGAALLGVLATGVATANTQQAVPPSAPVAQPACTEADSPVMTIEQISAAGEAVLGRCVTVEGVALGFRLLANNSAFYASPRDSLAPTSNGVTLGLYGRNRGRPPALVRVRGRANSCERISQSIIAGGGVPFLSGYCHYHQGMIIDGAVEDIRPFTFVRIPAHSAPDALVSIMPLAPGATRDAMAAAAAPFFAALRDNNTEGMTAMIQASQNQQAAQVPQLLSAPAVAAWRAAGAPTTIEYFGWRLPADATSEQRQSFARDAADGPAAIACAASTAFARNNLWPISAADTAIVSGRPYICVRLWLRPGQAPSYSFGIDDWGTAEP